MKRFDKALVHWSMGRRTEGKFGVFTLSDLTLFQGSTAIAHRMRFYDKRVVITRGDILGEAVVSYFDPARHVRGTNVTMPDAEFCTLMRASMTLTHHRTNPRACGVVALQEVGSAIKTIQAMGARFELGTTPKLPAADTPLVGGLIIAGAKWKLADTYDALLISPEIIRGVDDLGSYHHHYYGVEDYDVALYHKMKSPTIQMIDLKGRSS